MGIKDAELIHDLLSLIEKKRQTSSDESRRRGQTNAIYDLLTKGSRLQMYLTFWGIRKVAAFVKLKKTGVSNISPLPRKKPNENSSQIDYDQNHIPCLLLHNFEHTAMNLVETL